MLSFTQYVNTNCLKIAYKQTEHSIKKYKPGCSSFKFLRNVFSHYPPLDAAETAKFNSLLIAQNSGIHLKRFCLELSLVPFFLK